jgi:hypothetical protein
VGLDDGVLMDLTDYNNMCKRVQRGQIVAIAPAVDKEGNWHLVGLAGVPTQSDMYHLRRANGHDRALYALRAIHQARNHYGIA